MTFLFSPADDTLPVRQPEYAITVSDLLRERDSLAEHQLNVLRMLHGVRDDDRSYTPAVCKMTLSATRNAVEAYLKTLDALQTEVLPTRALPIKTLFGRQTSRDAALPATVSSARF